jgi:hypothetical protein
LWRLQPRAVAGGCRLVSEFLQHLTEIWWRVRVFFFISCGLIAASIFNSTTRQGKHDIRADTEVVKGSAIWES